MEIVALLLLTVLVWFWFDGIKARDRAYDAARHACATEQLQFLDDSVSRASLKLERDEMGRLQLRRVYYFEYSDTGNNRRPGSVVMLGQRILVLNIGLRLVSGATTLH